MAKEVKKTRSLGPKVERELWARAAGRCEFSGCNRLLYISPITKERVNIGEQAHIYSFSEGGPRGWSEIWRRNRVNEIENLMLMCHDCHKKIDQDKEGAKYSAQLLRSWKEEHEQRIVNVTGVDPSKASHVILYGANIGRQMSPLSPNAAKDALFPNWYPAEEQVVSLAMKWEGNDRDAAFWQTELENLEVAFNRRVLPLIERSSPNHFSIMAFAPMPLLTKLGTLFTDKVPAEVYQLHREPYQTWKWCDGPSDCHYVVNSPADTRHPPALAISLSASIAFDRVRTVLGPDVSIWELTIAKPHNDFLRSRDQLLEFREKVRKLMVDIGRTHGQGVPLAIFPAMPVACAVELGRVRMPKADGPWTIYDQNADAGTFLEAIMIGQPNA